MIGLNDNASTVSAVSAVRATTRNIDLPSKTAAAVSAVARLTIQNHSIRKHVPTSILQKHRSSLNAQIVTILNCSVLDFCANSLESWLDSGCLAGWETGQAAEPLAEFSGDCHDSPRFDHQNPGKDALWPGFFLTLWLTAVCLIPQLVSHEALPQNGDSPKRDNAPLSAKAQRIEVSRDLWISAVPQEQEGNNGESPRLKLKGVQEFFLIDFDPQPFQGRQVLKHNSTSCRRRRISAAHDRGVHRCSVGRRRRNQLCHNHQRQQLSLAVWFGHPWPGDSGDITGVTLGQMNTVWGFADPTPRDEMDWQIVEIDPRVVQARIDGSSQGFFVMDDVGSEYRRKETDLNIESSQIVSSAAGRAIAAVLHSLQSGWRKTAVRNRKLLHLKAGLPVGRT